MGKKLLTILVEEEGVVDIFKAVPEGAVYMGHDAPESRLIDKDFWETVALSIQFAFWRRCKEDNERRVAKETGGGHH